MEFLQPALLWGAVAMVIPVIIHFWYQKKGKTIAWAATQWLTDKTSLQHRGLRLDEIPLMLLRCLLVLLFVFLLSKPVMNWLRSNKATTKIHLVEPNSYLVNNFRFELENAIKKGEKIYWVGSEKNEVKDLTAVPRQTDSDLYLQEDIKTLNRSGDALNLYVTNSQKLAELSRIYVPDSFKLHAVIDSTIHDPAKYLELSDDKKLYVETKTGKLKVDEGSGVEAKQLAEQPIHEGKITVLIDYKNEAEQQTVQAALLALEETYSMPFALDFDKKTETRYHWIFTDQQPNAVDDKTLYFVSGKVSKSTGNVVHIQDSLRPSSSELVQNGQLPEWLGEVFVAHYKLKQTKNALSEQQLRALFVPVKAAKDQGNDKFYPWLLLFFILTLTLERWIALRKTVSQTYA